MRHRSIVLLAALIASGGAYLGLRDTASGVTAAHEYNHVLAVVIDGRNEVGADGRLRAGDPDGFGHFSAVLKGTKLCYGFQVVGIGKPIGAHIHRGAADESGAVVIPLRAMRVGSRCKQISTDLAKALTQNPGDFYVNVHTRAFPNGAVRGQLAHPARDL